MPLFCDKTKRSYSIKLQPESGIVERLSIPSDPPGINLASRTELTGFGAMAYVPRSEKSIWMADSGFPLNTQSVHMDEKRVFAPVREVGENYAICRNSIKGHTVKYEFDDDYFDIWLEGDLPDCDQVALDLDVPFMDFRQDDPPEYQFTVKSPYRSEDRSLCYMFLARPTGPGMLFTCLTPAAGWRLRYGRYYTAPSQYILPTHAIHGLQMVARFHSAIDKEATPGPIKLGVRISFHDTLYEAQKFISRSLKVPLLNAIVQGGEKGTRINFSTIGEATGAELICPDGKKQEVILKNASSDKYTGTIELGDEGFYKLRTWNNTNRGSDLILHSGISWSETMNRSLATLDPILPVNAEASYWIHSMCIARMIFGKNLQHDKYLFDALIRIKMQGMPIPIELSETEATHIALKMPKDGKWYLHAAIPEPHHFLGKTYSPFHYYKKERIQDSFADIQLFILAAKAFKCNEFIEHAVRMADALISDNIDESGVVYRLTEDGTDLIDYTTVICPLQAIIDLTVELENRKDKRAERYRALTGKIADFLVHRDLFFPTEGVSPHERWTEEGSIACTALSLLYAYWYIGKRREWLDAAGKVLDYHESWCLNAPDVRMNGSTNRYWETQWEGDGEGRAICAGHGWTLWRAEADFFWALATLDAKRLINSWNGFETSRCKFFPNGYVASCFTPDYLPDRPTRYELVHSYPIKPDRSLSYYVWPRLLETWMRTVAVVDNPEDKTLLTLNCHAEFDISTNRFVIKPLAPLFNRIIIISDCDKHLYVEYDKPFEICSKRPWKLKQNANQGWLIFP